MGELISGVILTVAYDGLIFLLCIAGFVWYRSVRAKPGAAFSELDLSSWESFLKIVSIDDTELAGYIHLEGYLYLNFIKNVAYFLLSSAFIASLTLIPLYTNLKFSSSTALSNLTIKHKELYDGDLMIPAICTFLLAIGSFILIYSYFILPRMHPTLFPSVTFI